jgi:hypothetical protein
MISPLHTYLTRMIAEWRIEPRVARIILRLAYKESLQRKPLTNKELAASLGVNVRTLYRHRAAAAGK